MTSGEKSSEKTIVTIPSSFTRLIREIGKLADRLVESRFRFLLVISGSDPVKLGLLSARAINYYVKKYRSVSKSRSIKGLYVYHDEFTEALKLKEVFEKKISSENLVEFEYAVYEKSEKYLGTTVQVLVMDLTRDLKPNDVGRLVGIVEGGGLIIFLTPLWSTWDTFKTIFKETLTVPQYPEPRHVFITWFKRKLLEHDGISIYDADNNTVIKKPVLKRLPVGSSQAVEIPRERLFPREVYELALTRDQVNVIKIIENFYEKPKRGAKKVLVLTADRGRGKSCAIGIGIVGFIHCLRRIKPRVRVLVTSPEPRNVHSLMTLASRTLEKLGFKYETVKREGYIVELKGPGFSIEYWEPLTIPKLKGDLVVVDEAAGVHVPLLYKILDSHSRLIFSTTIHGYEGSGRGFSVRFLKRLRSIENITLYQYEMEQPIRYGLNDPIENWQFKTLLLDAEPAELDEKDLEDIELKRLTYVKYDPHDLFNMEEELRQLFGIYVLAHYRNEPDDLGMLADAPHHIIRAVKTRSGKVVCAIQIAQEGPVDEKTAVELLRGGRIPGNILPDRFLKHTRLLEFSNTKGWRIVRIATHPAVQGKGIGSWALERVFEEASQLGLDWVGAGFGVTEELLRFWIRNGFSVVHISPERNPVSGEYTILVIKPLTDYAARLVDIAKYEFKMKLLDSISTNYRELEPEVVLLMLDSEPYTCSDPRSLFTLIALDRLWTYCIGPMTFEAAADLMFKIGRLHWLIPRDKRPVLSRLRELLLVIKALQGRTWDEASELLKKSVKSIQEEVHEIACIYFEYLSGKSPQDYTPGVLIDQYRYLDGAYT